MRIAACIVAYNPDVVLLRQNLDAFVHFVQHVYIWWNSPIITKDFSSDNVSYLGDGTNNLIATALNECLKQCLHDGYDFLLTMDQDSVFENFSCFLDFVSIYYDDKIIAYTPNVNSKQVRQEECKFIDYAYTSGSLCKVDSCIAIGGFREDYGIDWVDAEFCHRAQVNGYKLVCLTECPLAHRLGGSYGPFRYFHIFRNMIWMHREYLENPTLRTMLVTMRFYVRAIVRSPRSVRNIIACLHGSIVGIFQSPKRQLIHE